MKLLHSEMMIACPPVSTLLWDGPELVDVASNWRLCADGSTIRGNRSVGYPFDRAVGVRQNDVLWSVVYTNRGTKGLLMKNGVIQREINRSYYFANAYDYPIAMTVAPSGDAVLVHCPNSFDTIEVEDAETGRTLATKKSHDMEFHSRLTVSRNGQYLLDAGWFWHPLDGAWVCDLKSLIESSEQAGSEFGFSFGAGIDSAAFLDDENIVITSTEEVINEEIPPTGIGPKRIGVWSMANREWQSAAELSEPSGMLMPWREWAIAFREYPKAIEIATGKIVHRWDHLYSGRQVGSIDLGDPEPPPMALDQMNGRFAVSGPTGITVVTLTVG